MTFHSTQSDDYFWYLILHGDQEKTTVHPNAKFLQNFNGRNKTGPCQVPFQAALTIVSKISQFDTFDKFNKINYLSISTEKI